LMRAEAAGLRASNPVVRMLKWRTKLLTEDEVAQVLSAIANVRQNPFTLTELISLLDEPLSNNPSMRRAVSYLLSCLEEIGYLTKPSQRKWVKNASTLSRYLHQRLTEFSEAEEWLRTGRKTGLLSR